MIKLEGTGSPKEIASRMHISQRQLYNLLEQLRDMDAPIRFNRSANTYLYTSEFELLVSISIKVMKEDQLKIVYAGKKSLGSAFQLQGLCSDSLYLRYVMTN